MSKPPHPQSPVQVKKQTKKRARKRAQKYGRWAETLTAAYLRLTGHRVLARNCQTPRGEVDLIVRRANTVSFVEVKARPSEALALEAIQPRQRQRIERAAEVFLAHHPALSACEVRFDVALVSGTFRVRILRDAWRPENPTFS